MFHIWNDDRICICVCTVFIELLSPYGLWGTESLLSVTNCWKSDLSLKLWASVWVNIWTSIMLYVHMLRVHLHCFTAEKGVICKATHAIQDSKQFTQWGHVICHVKTDIVGTCWEVYEITFNCYGKNLKLFSLKRNAVNVERGLQITLPHSKQEKFQKNVLALRNYAQY